ncbi:uncharacterized protein N7443_007075 [Penicillium atrosanguineum]|uniref:uncharacterized protein n=1 Tax=Penicillium atrosanguineum TaxID=1132637 RepID=UPI00238818FC|nr:uncharacterized protein N7443_007075 [Penicillium atrosanguineum]KAJ5298955.1 hypothetical protein N7443_007075 [Penicillium atrosanguineum]
MLGWGLRQYMQQQKMATSTGGSAPKKDLCLLVLDGGGVRGLSMLLILKRLMEGIDPLNPPRPCDYFDMIGGTSTGGLIALMLGRMKMTVDECIKAYSALAPSIFTHIRHRIKLSNGETQGRFDHDAMESGIKELLSQNAIDSESLLKASVVEDCKTFVCATSRATAQTVVLSSYYNERRGSDLLNSTKIWEAARATSAATTFFEPITISDETFVDGATGANNPIQHMWSEAADVWGLQDNQLENNIKCLVSIGTGIPSLEAFGPGLKDVARALKSIALETEATAGIFRKHHTQLFQSDKAFRFNVVRGLENIGLEEASQLGAIKAATRNYVQMEEVLVDIKKCASNLQERESVESDISDLNDEDSHSTKDDLQWLKHTRDYETWKERGFGLLCSGHMVADWFFNSRGGEIGIAHAAFLQSILYQLLYQNEDLFKVAAPYYRQRSPHPENEWDAQTLRGLLNEISATGLPMVCIVDAMDETHALVNDPKICKTCRPRSIMYLLTTLIYDIQQSKMKFIVLSRPDPVIEMDFVGFQSCCLDAYRIVLELENKNDINMVIDRGLESLRESLHAYESEEEPKLKNAKPRKYKGLGIVKSMQVASKEETSLKSIRSYLKDNADGVILWVTLILQELSDHASGGLSTFAELDNLMRGLPRKLDMFYEYIIDKIQKQQSPEELAKTRMILILIAGSVTILPISLREMWEALAVPIDVKAALKSTMDPIVENLIPIKSWVGFRRLLRRKCGPLIEVVPLRRTPRHILDQGDDTDIGPDDILQFIHRTVKDFFNSPARKGYLHFSDQDARDETTAIAKRYIQITFPDEETLYGPPIPAKPRSSWKTNIRDYVDYLEKRNFLSLAKNMLCQTETAQVTTLGIYASIDKLIYLPRDPETSLYIDAKNARRIVGKNILFYPACTPTFDRGRGGSVESPVLGQAVRYACANGFVVAMRNMMIITQLHGETLLQDYAIYNGALVACIEAGQLDQIQSLTRRQRHQYQYLHGTKHIPRWPVGSYVESAHLDPFIQLAIQSGQEEIVEFLFNHTDHYYARQNAVIDFAVTKEDIRADDDRPGYFDPFLRSLSDVAEPSKRAAETSKSGILGMMNNLKKAFKSSFNRKHRTAGRPSWLEPKLPRSSNSSGSLDSLDQVQSSDELDVPKFTRTQVEAGFPGVSFGKPKDLDIVPSESDSKEPRPAPDLACVLDLHFENDSEAFLDFNDLDDLPLPAVETHRPKRDSTEIENSANRSGHTRPGEKDPDESDREVLIQPRRHDPAGIEHERKEFLELKIFCLEMAREKRKSRSDRDISVDEIREAIQLVIDAMNDNDPGDGGVYYDNLEEAAFNPFVERYAMSGRRR